MHMDIMMDYCSKLASAFEQGKSIEDIKDIEASIISAAMLASGFEWDTRTDTYVKK